MGVPFARSGDARFDCEALRKQDAAEFEALYRTFAPELESYLARLVANPAFAQDLLQETFVKAYRALPRTRPDRFLPRPWLYKIATNTARSAVRLARWKTALSFSRAGLSEIATSETGSNFENRFAEVDLVERALAAIKPDYAAPLLLHWREGFSIDEICRILDISRDNLKKRLYRAKKAFAQAYERECIPGEEIGGWLP